MKKNILHSRKFRHGSVSVALAVLIIVAVVIVNVIASALAARYSWMYIDMTSQKLYTLSEDAIDLLDKSFVDIIEKRGELNEKLPLTNHGIAEDNVKTAESNLVVAEEAVKTAKENLALALLNKVAFAQSVVKARSNHGIAETNLALAEGMVEIARKNADAEEIKLAEANLEIAKKNLEAAKKNLTIAAQNEKNAKENIEIEKYNKQNELREGDEGYRALLPYEELEVYEAFLDASEYGYGVSFGKHSEYENVAIAEENVTIAEKNLEITKENLEIAKENEAIAKGNADKSVIKGESGYAEPKEYKTALGQVSFVTVSNFTEPNEFLSVKKTATFEGEQGLYETDVKIKLIFCDLPDNLMKNESQRMVLETAKDLAERFPDYIEVEYIDIWNNSSAVQKYKTTSFSTINSTNIIVESGTEYRVCTLRSFFMFNSDSETTPWGYNGEKTFAANILSVAQAESPIACITVNHTETFSDYELLSTLQIAGYKVQTIDLAYQEIPEDCRLIVIYNPQEDFMVKDAVSDISEIEKIDRYLDGLSCSLMVFVNADTPRLPNLEEYLEEWGVVINRHTDQMDDTYNYVIKESASNSLTSDGFTFGAEYAQMGAGASIHESLRNSAYPPKVVFKNSTSLSYSELYNTVDYVNDDETLGPVGSYRYGAYSSNGVVRNVYDVFTTSRNAVAMANGVQVDNAGNDPFKLMTITREAQMVNDQDEDYATVMVCASTEFATEALLSSATFGNTDLILSAARGMGKEFVPVDLELKPFASTEISNMSTEAKNRATALLTIIPAMVVIGAGVFVLVRRKYS